MNLDVFYNIPVADQQTYYGKTYFKVFSQRDKEYIWGYCSGFLEANWAKFQFGEESPMCSVDLKESVPSFDYPDPGLYNLGNSTLYFHKVPRRQVKKGLCDETASFHSFSRLFVNKNTGAVEIPGRLPEVWKLKVIKEIFENIFEYSLADGIKVFQKRKPISFALNRDFGLSLGITSKYLSLWYRQVLVGEVPSPKEINLFPESLFHQEVLDKFLPENVNVNIGGIL